MRGGIPRPARRIGRPPDGAMSCAPTEGTGGAGRSGGRGATALRRRRLRRRDGAFHGPPLADVELGRTPASSPLPSATSSGLDRLDQLSTGHHAARRAGRAGPPPVRDPAPLFRWERSHRSAPDRPPAHAAEGPAASHPGRLAMVRGPPLGVPERSPEVQRDPEGGTTGWRSLPPGWRPRRPRLTNASINSWPSRRSSAPSSAGRILRSGGARRRRAHRGPDPASPLGGSAARCDPTSRDERPPQTGRAGDRHRAGAERPGLGPRRRSRGASQPPRLRLPWTARGPRWRLEAGPVVWSHRGGPARAARRWLLRSAMSGFRRWSSSTRSRCRPRANRRGRDRRLEGRVIQRPA